MTTAPLALADFSSALKTLLAPAGQRPLTIRTAAPQAQEVISYQMPAFKQGGILVYFAAWKKHIGFYPPLADDSPLKKEVAPYEGPKGNLIFPLNQPIPYDLIEKIMRHKVEQLKGN